MRIWHQTLIVPDLKVKWRILKYHLGIIFQVSHQIIESNPKSVDRALLQRLLADIGFVAVFTGGVIPGHVVEGRVPCAINRKAVLFTVTIWLSWGPVGVFNLQVERSSCYLLRQESCIPGSFNIIR